MLVGKFQFFLKYIPDITNDKIRFETNIKKQNGVTQ